MGWLLDLIRNPYIRIHPYTQDAATQQRILIKIQKTTDHAANLTGALRAEPPHLLKYQRLRDHLVNAQIEISRIRRSFKEPK